MFIIRTLRNPCIYLFYIIYIDCFFSRPTDNIGFSYVRRKLNSCLFKQSVSTHNVKLAEMRAIYDKVTTALVFFYHFMCSS